MKNGRKSNNLSRRGFGELLTVVGAVSPALLAQEDAQHQAGTNPTRPAAPQSPGNFRRPLVPDTPPFAKKLNSTRQDVVLKAEPFPMAQVRLLPHSVYYDAQEWNRGYLSRLESDRLLYTFRVNAGLPV